ncbi:hypothetical protein BDZ97DRAFT_1869712, partial [Flammula alnicola]
MVFVAAGLLPLLCVSVLRRPSTRLVQGSLEHTTKASVASPCRSWSKRPSANKILIRMKKRRPLKTKRVRLCFDLLCWRLRCCISQCFRSGLLPGLRHLLPSYLQILQKEPLSATARPPSAALL